MAFSPSSSAPLHSVLAGAGASGAAALASGMVKVGARLLGTAAVLALSLDGQGGQAHARRNAWAAMSAAHQGSLDRRSANDAMALSLAVSSGHPAGSARRGLDRVSPLAR